MEDGKGKVIFLIVLICVVILSPVGVVMANGYHYMTQKVDDATSYETKKEVEDTCRSLIVSYESDRLMYEQYKDSENAEQGSWANNARLRANKTAIIYNEYILKNSFVFQDNVPADIKAKLEVID